MGRRLRGLLAGAGFEQIEIAVEGRAVASGPAASQMAAFERAWFDAPEAVAYVTELGVSGAGEMAAIAAAWSDWADDPGACAVDQWFTALARVPGVR